MVKKVILYVLGLLIIVGLGLLACNVYIRLYSKPFVYASVESMPHTPVVMILGAGILNNGDLSPVLKDRTLMALSLYQAHKADKILITGNVATNPMDDEVTPVRLFLLKDGVAPADIFVDPHGYDTYTSMYRAKYLFGIQSLAITTQEFHLVRALFIARQLGMTAYGLPADQGSYQDKNYLREYFAEPKAVWDILIHDIFQNF